MAVLHHGARSWAGLVCGRLAEATALEVLGSYARTGVRWGNELVDAICDTRQSASLWGKSLVARAETGNLQEDAIGARAFLTKLGKIASQFRPTPSPVWQAHHCSRTAWIAIGIHVPRKGWDECDCLHSNSGGRSSGSGAENIGFWVRDVLCQRSSPRGSVSPCLRNFRRS
jgi:hypothetical protein